MSIAGVWLVPTVTVVAVPSLPLELFLFLSLLEPPREGGPGRPRVGIRELLLALLLNNVSSNETISVGSPY
jgi:hypothetical protein